MKTISIQCVHCHKRYNAPATMAGKKVKCKHCGKVFAIPAEAVGQDEGEAGLSAMGLDAQDTNAPSSSSQVGVSAASGSRGGGGKLGSASAGYASRMARNENATEIDFAENRPAHSLRPSIPFAFPGADVIEKVAPPIMIVIGLGWLGLVAFQSNDTGIAWAGPLRGVLYVALSLGLAFPLGYWAIKHAARKTRFMLPPKPGTRALAAFALAFAIALVLWLHGQTLGMLVIGTVLGLIVALGAVWFLFRVQPQEMAATFGGSAVALVSSVVMAYLLLFGIHTVFAVALAKSGTNPFDKSPVGPLAWDVPKVDPDQKPKKRTPTTIVVAPPPEDPTTQEVRIGATQPATQLAGTQPAVDPGAPKPVDPANAVAMVPNGTKPPETTPKPPDPTPGANGTPNPNATDPGKAPVIVESPLVATATPIGELPAGAQLFFPPGGAGTFGVLSRTSGGDELVELYTGNPPARSKVEVPPFAVEKNVSQNYILSNTGELMARLTSFPQVGVQIVSTATGKEVRTLPLETLPANGQPHLVGFAVNDWVIVLWQRPGLQQAIEVLNPRAQPTAQRVTNFIIDSFNAAPWNPIISPDGKQLAAATFVNNEGGIDLYDLLSKDTKRRPLRTLKVGLPKWTPPAGMTYGPGGTLSAYFELEGNGVLYHFLATNPNPVHTHTFRGTRVLLPQNASAFTGRTLEFVSPNEWLVFGRQLIDVESGKSMGELGIPEPKAQRVVDKDTLLIQSSGAGGREQLVHVKLKPTEVVNKRNELRGKAPPPR